MNKYNNINILYSLLYFEFMVYIHTDGQVTFVNPFERNKKAIFMSRISNLGINCVVRIKHFSCFEVYFLGINN